MIYGKIVDGKLEVLPETYVLSTGQTVSGLSAYFRDYPQAASSEGAYPVVFADKPPLDISKIYQLSYALSGGKIVETATATDNPNYNAEDVLRASVLELEERNGLPRAVRELVLAENSGASEYVKAQAREIEALAVPLREAAE